MKRRTTGLLSLALATAALALQQLPAKTGSPYSHARGWTVATTRDDTGTSRCTLQSVSDEVTAIVHLYPDDRSTFLIEANREFPSGTRLSLSVHDHRHDTVGETFSLPDSDGIVEDFLAGGTAYLEWRSPEDRHVIFRHILLLDGFHARLDECESDEPSQEARIGENHLIWIEPAGRKLS